ncbi:MAG: hypothetical protein LQ351_005727 [Letrouitia transgressa]|nr:MAG: hypothetical protein LQ351_005727 [Letrouitia transgressa]
MNRIPLGSSSSFSLLHHPPRPRSFLQLYRRQQQQQQQSNPFSHAGPALFYPRKEAQDRNSISVEPTEYSKSSSDAGAAAPDTAFDPTVTDPGAQKDIAGGEERGSKATGEGGDKGVRAGGNPLEVSPANKEVSEPQGKEGERAGGERPDQGGRERTSGGGSPRKGSRVS